MTIVVAVPESAEGRTALTAAFEEVRRIGGDLVVVNVGLTPLRLDGIVPEGIAVSVVERLGRGDRDPVDAVLDEIEERSATRLVICIKRRSPVGKLVLGSISQRLLLQSPVPVLAVKVPPLPESEHSARP
ncbi:universal stress protein [Tsukamurella ocularis]|uniref:universal stress protein n=1 Tax=Tsukamurella ocularis TaxID=1970234 RepID=UPI0039F11ADD